MVSAADSLWPKSRFSRPDLTRTLARSIITIIQVFTLQSENEIQFVPHRNHVTSPLQNESEIQFVSHRNHITSPLQNESETQFVPHRKQIT
jgi:hypothetical protein